MNTPAFVVVRTARTAIEADLIIAVLRSHGLHPLDLQTASHYSFGGADISYKVEVPSAEADQAKRFLAALDTPTIMRPSNPATQRPRKPDR